ncbi:DNA polymerase alpha subunit B [Phymastichus coffea]|uniref:DNA polymerase alpha subunit B n=1 Tax=Phymastichus coffea TaxID=108790 RepID=UPI00273AC68C|nr:DNA polymerase alpha subunit B [Phymastichus coffea]
MAVVRCRWLGLFWREAIHSNKMVSKALLLENFQITGYDDVSDEVLEKCVELCHWYNKSEEEFGDIWVAFCIQHQDGNLNPTLEALEELKKITPREEKGCDNIFKKHQEQNIKLLNSSKSEILTDNEQEILKLYATPEAVNKLHRKRAASPDLVDSSSSGGDGCKIQATIECSTPSSLEQPSSIDTDIADATQSQLSFSQSNITCTKGGIKVVLSVGQKVSIWATNKKYKCSIKHAGPRVPANSRYMFELLKTASEVRTRVCRIIGYKINVFWKKQKKDDLVTTWNVRTRSQKPYRTWGRVCFESETKKWNVGATILLEGCRKPPRTDTVEAKLWPQVELDVSDLPGCSIFPGQIIAVEGTNLTENLLKVKDVFTGSFIPAAQPPYFTDDLKVMVAAGPFTQSNDLNYQPLYELMARVAEDEPHVLILIGPFVDYNHPHIQSGEANCSHQEIFNKIILNIKNNLVSKCTQVVLVASGRDAHHHAIYPTPEYFIPKSLQGADIHVLPDPCTLDIDGLRLGITSVDVLMHLGREEVTIKSICKDKLSRLGNYILNQACYYPLYPSAKEINIDCELWEKYAFLKEKPHMLLLPSDMRYFCKHVNESVILNPERLSKRVFARINFKPSVSSTWTPDNISCEIIKM